MKLCLLVALMFVSFSIKAQFVSVPVSHSTPYGNFTTYNTIRMPMGNYGAAGPVNNKYTFFIVLKNDSVLEAKTRININDSIHSITIKKPRKREIKPSETKEIYRIEPSGYRFSGFPTDSCWLFKTYTAKINVYSFLAEKNLQTVIAVQKGESAPVVKLTRETLMEMVADDEKALKLAEKKKFEAAIRKYNGLK